MSVFDCLAFGSSAFDVLMSVDRPPRSDERVGANAVTSGGGGPAATASTAMARLNLKVGIVTAVGADVFGRLMIEEFERFGVETSGIQIVPGSSTLSAVLIETTNARRSMIVYGGCINRIDLDGINFERIRQARSIHLDGNNPRLAERAARAAREAGVPVYLDGGNIATEPLSELLPLIDVYIPDEQSVQKQLGEGVTPEEACRIFKERGPSLVVITRAEHGSIAFDGSQFWSAPAYGGVSIVDTTGAGDNFHGAFLAARLDGLGVEEALRFSNTYAALCCRGIGGRATAPDRTETLEHLAMLPA
jgi:sugar/nucleoside kinase (ribokinase family)